MALNPLRIFLFLAGAAVAGLGVAYFTGSLDPLIFGKPAEVASLPGKPAGQADAKGERLPAPAKPASEKPAMQAETPTESAATKGDGLLPTFDVVRVEPDGSVVVAGKAAANAKVEVLAGDGNVVAAGAADGGGDFAIVFDDPLKPGDYQLTLRATPPGDEAVASAQTAIVSVPEKADGQVLAMVEEPGKPSQVITAPEPGPAQKPAQETAAAEPPAPDKPNDVASASEPKPAEAATEAMKPAEAATPAAESEPAEEPAAPASAMASAEPKPEQAQPAEAATEPAPAPAEAAKPVEEPAAPANAMASTEPKPEEAKPAEAVAEPAPAPAETAKPAEEPTRPASEMASAGPKAEEPAKPAPAKPAPSVSVQAVEIEGKQIFVAGNAEPGRTVRVYANEEVLGEAKTAPNGRFLIEANKELAVGNYIIRADMLGDDGAQVIARAAVPFEREPGESIAAVAPEPAPAGEKPAEVASARQPAASEPAKSDDKPAAPASVRPAPVKPADVAAAEPGAPATADSASKPADATAKPAEAAVEPAKPTEAAPEPVKPAETATAQAKSGELAAAPAAGEVGNGKPAEVAAAEPAAPAQLGDRQLPKLDNGIASSPPEVLSAKLERTNDAVIIRRGDSLWRISRRVYGRGIRYSTIYLANQEQIKDPDLIWPGQIFEVPEKTEQGDTADMSKIGDQATSTAQ